MYQDMQNLDVVGNFWLARKPGRRVAGRLTFNESDGLELNLIGSLHDPEEVLAQRTGPVIRVPLDELYGLDSEPVRILGETTNGDVTLDNCLRKSGKFPLIGTSRVPQEVYHSDVAFLGAHFGEGEPLVFNGFSLSIQTLEHWIGLSAVSIELDYDENSKQIEQVRIIDKPRGKLAAKTSLGDLELSFESVLVGDHISESTIRQKRALKLRFSESRTLQDTLRVCTSLQDLVTIGIGAPVSINGISLMGNDTDRAINFVAQLIGAANQEENKPPHPGEMLFTFEAIGGLEGLAKWLDISDKYQLVIDALLSPQYRPPWYTEHRFFDAITAAETLARIRQREEHINRYKLKQLGHEAGPEFEALVGDVDQWTDLVWDARRDNLLQRGLREGKRLPLHLLADSLYFLVILCLLRECGVGDDTLANIQKHRKFRSLAEELRST